MVSGTGGSSRLERSASQGESPWNPRTRARSAQARPGKSSSTATSPSTGLGLGAMRLPTGGFHGPPRDPEVGRAVLRRAVELGVDHIDTAAFYRKPHVRAGRLGSPPRSQCASPPVHRRHRDDIVSRCAPSRSAASGASKPHADRLLPRHPLPSRLRSRVLVSLTIDRVTRPTRKFHCILPRRIVEDRRWRVAADRDARWHRLRSIDLCQPRHG